MTSRDAANTKEVRQEGSLFVIRVDGEAAGFAEFVESDGVRNFNHTVVDPQFRGQGLSEPLIKQALDSSIADDFKIVPTCSAVERFIAKNPEYKGSIA